MRVVLQRVTEASVEVGGTTIGQIGAGMLVLVAFRPSDTLADVSWMAGKLSRLRIFDDAQGVMNRSVVEAQGALLVVSQFTLYARTRKGNRPAYVDSAPGPVAEPLYEAFLVELEKALGHTVAHGQFGADMQVHLINDGPVTIIIDAPGEA